MNSDERVTLTTSRGRVAEEYAKLLSFYGVGVSVKHANTTATSPNGKDYGRTYDRYEAVTSFHQVNRFVNVFKISHQDKAARLALLVKPRRQSMKAGYVRVKSVTNIDEQVPVWDIKVNHPQHVFPTQWSYTGNCGEVPLLNNEPCNLGSINLGRFTDGTHIDWAGLGVVTRLAIKYLDDIVSLNTFPSPEIEAANLLTRKLGLGVCGWADLLALHGIDYDTQEAVSLGGKVMRFINDEAYQASMELAAERGSAPAYRAGSSSPRNATRTCIAPTGTIAILMGASSGVEPHFALEWNRTLGNGTVLHESVPVLDRLGSYRPPVSHDISPRWHILHQSAFQAHTDLAVSKTINLPNDATVGDVYDAYVMMWETGCKGGTIFRDGCRSEQVLNVTNQIPAEVCPVCDAGVVHIEGCIECEAMCGWSVCST